MVFITSMGERRSLRELAHELRKICTCCMQRDQIRVHGFPLHAQIHDMNGLLLSRTLSPTPTST